MSSHHHLNPQSAASSGSSGSVQQRMAQLARAAAQATAQRQLAAMRDDPVAFAAACGITALDEWQRAVLESHAPRILLACGRQTGKSTAAALLALHTAVYQPGALVLVLSAALRQSQELFRKVLALLAGVVAQSAGALHISTDVETQLTLQLPNGSRLVALPGSPTTVRSFSAVSLLILDEAAHVPSELLYATLPMLAVSGGRLMMLSSCYGKRGVFWEAWRDDGPDAALEQWERYRVPASACPRISRDFLAEARRRMGEWWYRSEFLAEFLDAQTAAFKEEWIERAIQPYEMWDIPWNTLDERQGAHGASTEEAAPAQPTAARAITWERAEAAEEAEEGQIRIPAVLPPVRPEAAVQAERASDPIWRALDGQRARGLW